MKTTSTNKPLTVAFAFAIGGGFVVSSFAETANAAGRASLRPEQREQMKQQIQDYNKCRQGVLANVKSGKLAIEQSKASLDACRQKFSGAGLYADCKSKVLANKKNQDPGVLKKAIIQCQDYLVAGNFNPDDPFPFKLAEDGTVTFAGVEFNIPAPVAALNPANFDCANLVHAAADETKARFSFFGNHPRLFGNLAAVTKKSDLYKLFRISRMPANQKVMIKGFGEIDGDPAKKDALLYFPTGQCDYERTVGRVYSGLQVHYLLDSAKQEAVPYIAVAYYQPNLASIAATDIEKKLVAAMGPTTTVTMKKGDFTRFMANGPLTEFDTEGDPKHLCKKPRKQGFLGIIRASQGYQKAPDYLLLANIKNLCEYGDRLAGNLTQP